ncbi:SET domain-containing protein [Aquicella lusitana]|uniref:SET domain-containing protein n=1 Tax=Aquicella lusitana TaxID=254246 RepID=A0A370GRJ9_9COXI|nr:SET domain-containing protein-lysine N-methyltransferase [Aquicella lusitana]RDI46029.1 SET domain-containing protein [Aquicella lusitana]VVC73374.1 hypothetical protein AQULUS_11130 [Aquicella lusitana]
MKYRHFAPYFLVKKGIHGVGVFAAADIKKGEILRELTGEMLDHPTRTSIQIGKNKHIEDEMGGLINHSCQPTARIDKKNHSLVSIRNIRKGEEITFDYNENEEAMASPFVCQCCGKYIMGKKGMPYQKRSLVKSE